MLKVRRYTGNKTYMHPSSEIADRAGILAKFPAALTFTHIATTDEAEEVLLALENLAAVRTQCGLDPELSEDEAIAAIEEIVNTMPPEPEPSPEERIAAALEFSNVLAL